MIYVGIDVAANKHDCFLMSDHGEVYSSSSFIISNDIEGYKKLHNSINDFVKRLKDSNVRIGLESTGHYSNNILYYLFKAGFQTTLINPILTNMDRKATTVRKTKTDKVDARGICMFLDRNRNIFKPYTPLFYHKNALKSLSRERFFIVKDYSKQKVKLQRLINIVFPEYLSRYAIHLASNIIRQHDKTFREYYEKKVREGKHHYVILGHVDKKQIRIIFTILKKSTFFIPQN